MGKEKHSLLISVDATRAASTRLGFGRGVHSHLKDGPICGIFPSPSGAPTRASVPSCAQGVLPVEVRSPFGNRVLVHITHSSLLFPPLPGLLDSLPLKGCTAEPALMFSDFATTSSNFVSTSLEFQEMQSHLQTLVPKEMAISTLHLPGLFLFLWTCCLPGSGPWVWISSVQEDFVPVSTRWHR